MNSISIRTKFKSLSKFLAITVGFTAMLNLSCIKPVKATQAMKYMTVSFPESAGINKTQTITIPNLQTVVSTTVNTGSVTKTVNSGISTRNQIDQTGGYYSSNTYNSIVFVWHFLFNYFCHTFII